MNLCDKERRSLEVLSEEMNLHRKLNQSIKPCPRSGKVIAKLKEMIRLLVYL